MRPSIFSSINKDKPVEPIKSFETVQEQGTPQAVEVADPSRLELLDRVQSKGYVNQIYPSTDPNALLYENQSKLDIWANAAIKTGAKLGTSFVNTVIGLETSVLNTLLQGAARGGDFRASDFTQDPLTKAMHNIDTEMENLFPVYSTGERSPWYSRLGSASFWADDVMKNFGFAAGTALGAMATGGTGLLPKLMGKGYRGATRAFSRALGDAYKTPDAAADIMKALGTGEKIADAVEATAKNSLYHTINLRAGTALSLNKDLIAKNAQQILGATIAATTEAKFEAVGTYNEIYDDFIKKGYSEEEADRYAKIGGNVDFAVNLPVLIFTDAYQFGKAFTAGKTFKSRVGKAISGEFDTEFKVKSIDNTIANLLGGQSKYIQGAAKGLAKGVQGIYTYGKSPFMEGFEEWAQYQGNKVAKNYTERVADGLGGGLDSFLSANSEVFSNLYGEEGDFLGGQGAENFVLGALLGGIGVPTNLKGDFSGGIVGTIQDNKRKATADANLNTLVDTLNTIRTKYGNNEALKSLAVKQSYNADAMDALQKGDIATFKLMEAGELANDIFTAVEAGKGDEFLKYIGANNELSAAEIRDMVKQQTKEGDVDPIKDLTDVEVVEKYNKNKEEAIEQVKSAKKIYNVVSNLRGINPALAKEVATNLFMVTDLEKRYKEVTKNLNESLDNIKIEDPEKAAKFEALKARFLNNDNIKQTLANVVNNKEFAEFSEEAITGVFNLVKDSVIDIQEGTEIVKSVLDLQTSAGTRKLILDQYNKILNDPSKYNEWTVEKLTELSPEKELTNKVGKAITNQYKSAGINVPENIFDVEEGTFYGKMGNQTVTIRKEKGKEAVIKIAGKEVNADKFLALMQLTEFTPLTAEQANKFWAAKKEQKEREDKRTLVIKKIEGEVEKYTKTLNETKAEVDAIQKERQKHLDKLNELDTILQEAKKELTALYKSKNSKNFKRTNTVTLKALLKELNTEIEYINNELSKIDTSVQKLQGKEAELQEKTQMLETELAMLEFGDYTLEERVAELIEAAKDPGIQQQIEALMAEKDSLLRRRDNFIAIQEKLKDLFDKAENETQLERYLTRIEEIDEILNVLDEQLASLNSELKDLQKVAFNPELMERARRLQAVIDKVIEDSKYTQKEDKKPVGAEPFEESGVKPRFTDSAAKPITVGFFTTASSQTDDKDVDRDDPRTVRWFKYINETPLKELKETRRLLVFNKNSEIDKSKLGEELVDTQGEYLDNYVMITDTEGNPIEDNGFYVWSPLHKPGRDKSKFSYPKKEDGTSFTEEEKQEMYNQAQKKYIEFVNKVSTEKVLLPITNRSVGINKYKTGNTILAATGEDVKSLPLVVATSTRDRVVSVELPQNTVPNVPVGTVLTETERGDYLVVNQNTLSQQDAEATYELIKLIVAGEAKIDGKDLRAILENIIFVGKTKSPYSFFFYPNKDGEGKGGITIGGKSIAKDLMESQKEEIINFLQTKRYNVNKASLEKAQKNLNSNKPEPFFMPKITEAGLDFEKYESYKHFLVDSSIRSLDAMPLTVFAPNLGEIGNKNKYLTFSEPKKETKKKGKAAPVGETVSIGEILGTEGAEDLEESVKRAQAATTEDKTIAELRAKEEAEVKKIIPNIDEYKVDGVINKDKVLAGIEERKQEELKKAESTTTEIVEETPPTGKKVFVGTPSKDGYFINKNVKTKFDEVENVYEFILTSDTTAKFKVHSHSEAIKSALRFPDKTIDPASTSLNAFSPSATGIKTIKYGEAVLEGDKWVIKTKAEIEYTGGNTKPAQATSGISVKAVGTKQSPSFYLGLPVGNKKFLNEDVSVKFNNQESVYEFHYTNPAKTKATFKVTDNPNSHLSAIRSKDVAIETVSTATNAFRTDAKRVNTIEEGEAELIDGYWVVTKKAKIEYGDSPLDKNKAVEAKYKSQADAYNEIYDRYDKLITEAAKGTTTNDNDFTPVEGLNERLNAYGNAELIFSPDFFEGKRPEGKLNGFKSLLSQIRENMLILADVDWNNFDFFLNKEDIEKLDALKPLAEELKTINTLKIATKDTRTVGVEKRYAQLSNQLINATVDILGKHVVEQLGKSISSSKPKLTTVKNTTEAPVTEAWKAVKANYFEARKANNFNNQGIKITDEASLVAHLQKKAAIENAEGDIARKALEKLETKEEQPSLEGVQDILSVLPEVTTAPKADKAAAVKEVEDFYGPSAGVTPSTLAEAKEVENGCGN